MLPILRRATCSASHTSTARRSYSGAISRRRSPTSRASPRGSTTFRDWNRKAEEITARIFLPERFSEPLPQAEREALLSRSDIGRDFLAATKRQPFDVVQELFENEHVQLLFLFKISLFGTWLVDTMSKTSPMGSVIRAFDLQSGYQLCKGGSANLARGLMETFIAAGGRFAPQVELDRIVIEGSKATGIALKDGRTVRAQQFVASTLNVHQTFEDYIGRAQLLAAFLKKLDEFEYTKWTIFGLHLALHEAVRFHSEKFDPNIHRTLKWSLGAETMGELLAAHKDVTADRVPQIVQFGSGALSVLDPTQAPPGKHTTTPGTSCRLIPTSVRATTRRSSRSSPSGSSRNGRATRPT